MLKRLIPRLLGGYINTVSYVRPSHAAAFGFRMFCYPFRAPLRPHQKEFLASAEQSDINHNGVAVRTYRWHTGPRKVLFLHGWQSHSFRWKNYIEQFPASEYSLYALDAPGHGLSSGSFLTVPLYSDVVEKFIAEHGPFDTIISHSLGSFTTLYTLNRRPLLPVAKLVLLASPGEAREFFDFYRQTLKLSPRAIELIERHFENVIGDTVSYFSAPEFARELHHPALIIHDEEDDETPHSHSVSIHKALRRSKLMITKGLSHNLKSPDVVQTVLGFVKGEKETVTA